MSLTLRPYRLVSRGEAGLACDVNGLALGSVELVRLRRGSRGSVRCEVRSPSETGRIARAAYGPQPDTEILRLHRGLRRVAVSLEAGDLARAGVEAVMLRLPDLMPEGMARLAEIADLAKSANEAWETEPRLPSGQSGGGEWTTGGTPSGPASNGSEESSPPERPHRPPSTSSDSAGASGAALRGSRPFSTFDQNLLVPVSTAGVAVGGPGMVDDFALPASVARLGRAALLGIAAGALDRWDEAVAKEQIANAIARFGLNPARPADVLAASAYVWSRYALPALTDAPFSGPRLDAASQAVMRFVMAAPGAFFAIQNPTPQNADLARLILRAANGGLADYAVESRARPPGVAPELQTTSRSARAAIADMLKNGGQAHHLIPAAVWHQKIAIANLAAQVEWRPDNPSNLIALPSNEVEREKMGGFLPLHNQYHDLYNKSTAAQIDVVRQNFPPELTPVQARAILEAVALRNWLEIMRGKYNPIMKAGE